MQKLGDVGPLVSVDFVRIENDSLFFIVDGRLFDARVKVVMPSFPALLSSAAADVVLVGQLLRDEGPSLGTVFGNQVNNGVILLD